MRSNDSLIVTGNIPNSTIIQLYKGWNLVGCPITDIREIGDLLNSTSGNYTAVQSYDALDELDPWKHYNINKPEHFNDHPYMTSGKGYWIYVKNDCIWEINNS
jgi:hypothetical protein